MAKEQHPYLHHFDSSRVCKYLILGTFPPRLNCGKRQGKFQYFYGNEASIWKILEETGLYPEIKLDSPTNIMAWQEAYSVGVTDVLTQCRRKPGKECSPSDADLLIDLSADLNTSIKEYILRNREGIEKIYFTSGSEVEGGNSAFWLFSKLMGREFIEINRDKLIKLPAPTGEFLRTVFKQSNENYGLKQGFYDYLTDYHPEALDVARLTFAKKQGPVTTRINRKGEEVPIPVKRFPNCPNYPSLYRVHLYRSLMPTEKVVIEG